MTNMNTGQVRNVAREAENQDALRLSHQAVQMSMDLLIQSRYDLESGQASIVATVMCLDEARRKLGSTFLRPST